MTFSTSRQCQFDSKGIRMPIERATKPIDDKPMDSSSPLVAEPYPGVARSSQEWHCWAERPNTMARPLSHVKPFTSSGYWRTWTFPSKIRSCSELSFPCWTEHIKVHYHFIQERVLAGDVDLQHISTSDPRSVELEGEWAKQKPKAKHRAESRMS